jgi:hypothetical protein
MASGRMEPSETQLSAPGAAYVRGGAPFALIVVIALLSRMRYSVWGYHYTFGSGDADLILTKAMFISRGEFRPPLNLGSSASLFGDPPLIPLIFAAAHKVFHLPLDIAPLIVTPALTIVALFALYAILRRAFDATTALVSVCLLSLLPRFSFDSTEPDKVAFVTSFFIIALFFIYEAQTRPRLYLAAGLFMGLSVFSHNTGYLFLPVYGLSHVALSRGSERRLFDRYFIASLAIPLLFIGAYLQLNDHFVQQRVMIQPAVASAPAPSTAEPVTPLPVPGPPPAPANRHRFVPSSVQLYWDSVTGLARRGFDDSAWNRYFDAIRRQVLDPVYVLAIAGFVAGCALVVARRRYELVPLLVWMALVTLGFAIQYNSFSHQTRYPSYVTPVFVAMACFFAIWLARAVLDRLNLSDVRPWYALVAAGPLFAFLAASYATAPDPGLRIDYGASRQLAEYVTDHRLLDGDTQMLYLGWPAVTMYTLDARPDYETRMEAFGWGNVPLARFSPAYIAQNHIRYFAYDHTGRDYFHSADKMLDQLERDFTLRRVQLFCGPASGRQADPANCHHGYVILYALEPKA